MAYDEKYRRRAIEHWGEGNSKRTTAALFKVSPTTLQGWKSQLKESGTLAPKERKRRWRKIDPEKLCKYIESHPDAYQHEIADAFGVRLYAIQKALKRLGITRKKTASYKEADERLRQEFVEKLEAVPPGSIVYVDETGIDQYLYREYAYSPRGQKVFTKISGRKYKRTNIVAGICKGEWVAPMAADRVLYKRRAEVSGFA